MWGSGIEDALVAGVPYELYWGDMTPVLLQKYFNAFDRKQKAQLNLLDTANHVLGIYIRVAIGDALGGKKNYPDKPLIQKAIDREDQKEMSDEDMVRMAERNTAILTGLAQAKKAQGN